MGREETGHGGGPARARGAGEARSAGRASAPPTPVRDLARSEAPAPPTDPDAGDVEIEVGGERWCVTVLGRSGGGGATAVPLLLLGFSRVSGAVGRSGGSTATPVEREALVVGRTLAGLTDLELEEALALSKEPTPRPPPSKEDRPRRRGRGGGATGRRGR